MNQKDHFQEDDDLFNQLGFKSFDENFDDNSEDDDTFVFEDTSNEDSFYDNLKYIKKFEIFDDLEIDDDEEDF